MELATDALLAGVSRDDVKIALALNAKLADLEQRIAALRARVDRAQGKRFARGRRADRLYRRLVNLELEMACWEGEREALLARYAEGN